jgi:hypothetical protein
MWCHLKVRVKYSEKILLQSELPLKSRLALKPSDSSFSQLAECHPLNKKGTAARVCRALVGINQMRRRRETTPPSATMPMLRRAIVEGSGTDEMLMSLQTACPEVPGPVELSIPASWK